METISSGTGDLAQRVDEIGHDEVAQIARSFNSFVATINSVMIQMRDSSEAVRHAANESASGNHGLSRRIESAAASLEETAASIEEITATVTQSADAARQADQTATTSADAAARGGSVVADTVITVREIEGASEKIIDIISVMEGIAFQTNIIALNAAVEAVRAGEDGRDQTNHLLRKHLLGNAGQNGLIVFTLHSHGSTGFDIDDDGRAHLMSVRHPPPLSGVRLDSTDYFTRLPVSSDSGDCSRASAGSNLFLSV
jgi:hypothetical protein